MIFLILFHQPNDHQPDVPLICKFLLDEKNASKFLFKKNSYKIFLYKKKYDRYDYVRLVIIRLR